MIHHERCHLQHAHQRSLEPVIDREAASFGDRADATVTSAQTGPCSCDPTEECHAVEFELTGGPDAGIAAVWWTILATEGPPERMSTRACPTIVPAREGSR